MQDLSIDIKTMPQAFGGYHLLLVITCDQTNFTIAVPLRDRTAQTVAEALIYRVIYLFRPPRQIICGEATEFSSAIIQAILCMLNCRFKVISPYNHGSSKCERQIQTVSEIIMKHLWDKGQMWPLFATTAAYAMNTFAYEVLSGLSPFQLVFLRDPPNLTSLSFPKIDTIPVKHREYYNLLLARAQLVGNIARSFCSQLGGVCFCSYLLFLLQLFQRFLLLWLCINVLRLLGNVVRVYPRIIQGLTFLSA